MYSAKRYLGKENEIGLFSHTPDRCWTATGWKVVPTQKSFVEFSVHDVPMLFERRIFSNGKYDELVYFGALVGGRPLPYRLDQYHSFAEEAGSEDGGQGNSALSRLAQTRVWGWAFESFSSRTPLAGPQQFIRISTAIHGENQERADLALQSFLNDWLEPTDYQAEFDQWKKVEALKAQEENNSQKESSDESSH